METTRIVAAAAGLSAAVATAAATVLFRKIAETEDSESDTESEWSDEFDEDLELVDDICVPKKPAQLSSIERLQRCLTPVPEEIHDCEQSICVDILLKAGDSSSAHAADFSPCRSNSAENAEVASINSIAENDAEVQQHLDWSVEVEKYHEELHNEQLARPARTSSADSSESEVQNMTKQIAKLPRVSPYLSSPGFIDEELRNMWALSRRRSPRITGESPSIASEYSELSIDSGLCGSSLMTGCHSSASVMTPQESTYASALPPADVYPMYEFEVPQDYVGLLIGQNGRTIKSLMDDTGAYIVIRRHHWKENHKICTLEGTPDQINKCLNLIRRRFPLARFPELILRPLAYPSGGPASPTDSTGPFAPTPVVPTAPVPQPNVDPSAIQLTLPLHTRIPAVLSSVVDAGHFFVQQITHPTYPQLETWNALMNNVYNQVDSAVTIPSLPKPIQVGIICAATLNGSWYRAVTVGGTCNTNGKQLVRFVDYGGYTAVQTENLKQIRADLLSLPFQACECHLAGVRPKSEDDRWTADAKSAVEMYCRDKPIQVEVIYVTPNGVFYIEIYVPHRNDMYSPLSQLLIEDGHARPIERSPHSHHSQHFRQINQQRAQAVAAAV